MKVLSIKQPFATLCAAGLKDVENRSWTTKFRGTLLIHSSTGPADLFDKSLPLKVFQEFDRIVDLKTGEQIKTSKILRVKNDVISFIGPEKLRHEFEILKTEIAEQIDNSNTLFLEHAIVGSVDLVDVIQDSKSKWSCDGSYHWILKNAVLFGRPVLEVKGKLRLWTFPDDNHILNTKSKILVER